MPEQEVSTLFLAGGVNGSGEKDDSAPFTLRLRGGGKMHVTSCVFADGKMTIVHPLLGSMQIPRDGINFLERREVPKAKTVKGK